MGPSLTSVSGALPHISAKASCSMLFDLRLLLLTSTVSWFSLRFTTWASEPRSANSWTLFFKEILLDMLTDLHKLPFPSNAVVLILDVTLSPPNILRSSSSEVSSSIIYFLALPEVGRYAEESTYFLSSTNFIWSLTSALSGGIITTARRNMFPAER